MRGPPKRTHPTRLAVPIHRVGTKHFLPIRRENHGFPGASRSFGVVYLPFSTLSGAHGAALHPMEKFPNGAPIAGRAPKSSPALLFSFHDRSNGILSRILHFCGRPRTNLSHKSCHSRHRAGGAIAWRIVWRAREARFAGLALFRLQRRNLPDAASKFTSV